MSAIYCFLKSLYGTDRLRQVEAVVVWSTLYKAMYFTTNIINISMRLV